MSENKVTKYLKYAIGEIFLVMIGILLALQINNWNELRKDRIKERVVLTQLMEDYQANLEQLEEKMKMRITIINSGFQILQAIDHPDEVDRHELINQIANITNDPTFDPIENDLISSGNIRLISNNQLKRILSNWTSDIIALKEMEAVWSEKTFTQIEPLLYDLGIARDIANSWINETDHPYLLDGSSTAERLDIGTSYNRTTLDAITGSIQLEGIVSDAIAYNVTANIQSEALKSRIEEIISLIRSELEN